LREAGRVRLKAGPGAAESEPEGGGGAVGRLKGSILVGVVKRAKREPGVRELLAPEAARFLDEVQVDTAEWYPLDVADSILTAVERAVTGGNESLLLRDFGVLMAQVQLSGTYKAFRVADDPERQILLLPVMWKSFFDDGEWTCERQEPGRIELCYAGGTTKTDAVCRSAAGFLEEAARMAGAAHAQITKTACRLAGDEDCRYQLWWE
jgi:hypothetical protein